MGWFWASLKFKSNSHDSKDSPTKLLLVSVLFNPFICISVCLWLRRMREICLFNDSKGHTGDSWNHWELSWSGAQCWCQPARQTHQRIHSDTTVWSDKCSQCRFSWLYYFSVGDMQYIKESIKLLWRSQWPQNSFTIVHDL